MNPVIAMSMIAKQKQNLLNKKNKPLNKCRMQYYIPFKKIIF